VIRKAVWLGKGEPPTPRPQPEAAKGKRPVQAEPTPAAEPPPPKASPVPAPASEIPAEVKQEEVIIPIGDRRYRVRGLAKNLAYDVLKINLLVRRGEGYHADTFDLYSARPRQAWTTPRCFAAWPSHPALPLPPEKQTGARRA